MLVDGGLRKSAFNTDYNELLPLAQGNILLVETHRGIPIVSIAVLEAIYPNASSGLKAPNSLAEVEGTRILFVDFAKLSSMLDVLDECGLETKSEQE